MNRWDDQGNYYTAEDASQPRYVIVGTAVYLVEDAEPLEVSPPCELLPEAEAHCEPRIPNCWKRYGA